MENKPERKRIRLQKYDYSTNSAYHVTICTKERQTILSRIVVADGKPILPMVVLTEIGQEVKRSIEYIEEMYEGVFVDRYVIMPDHVHMLIKIDHTGGHGGPPLHEIIKKFKTYTTHRYGSVLWQRSYHDHIIRGQQDYDETWQYIENNPIQWMQHHQ